jgi:DNA repair protein RadC
VWVSKANFTPSLARHILIRRLINSLDKEVEMAIRDWAADDRPRERLIRRGARHLTDTELLAILIGSGTQKLNALELARHLLDEIGSLNRLSRLSFRRLGEYRGFGQARFACLHAGMEIGRRTMFDTEFSIGTRLENSKNAEDYIKNALFSLQREVFACLFLDTRHKVLSFDVISEGTIDRAAVYPREVVRRVIDHDAAAVIFCHNHPSGSAIPSDSDKLLTNQLKSALSLIDVKVLDHFIVAGEACISFADLGLLQ